MSAFSAFGANTQSLGQQQGTNLFGSLNTTTQPSQSPFGSLGQANNQQQNASPFTLGQGNQQQQNASLFTLGQSNQQQQNASPFTLGQNNQQQQNASPFTLGQSNQQQTGGLFASLGQNQQQPQQQQQPQSSAFGGLGQITQPTQNNAFGGFGQSAQQQPQQSSNAFGSFGQSAQKQPQQTSLFGSLGQSTQQQNAGIFGQNQNNQQNQQNQQQGSSFFVGANQINQQSRVAAPNLAQSQLWQPQNPREKNVLEEMKSVIDKWDPASPNCVFRYYFYNKVDERWAPYYSPAPYEDPKAWEEALAKKPGPGYIPVLCTGFQQMGERIKIQQQNLAFFNKKLHEINDSLDAMLNKHDLVLTVRALDARRRHTALKQRCLALATKAQVLRNRGYAMSASEEVLRDKLSQLEKGVCDPRVSARGEEIWARLVSVRERGKLLRDEVERRASSNGPVLDEEALRRAEKVLETYGQQLQRLKKELNQTQEEFNGWQNERRVQSNPR